MSSQDSEVTRKLSKESRNSLLLPPGSSCPSRCSSNSCFVSREEYGFLLLPDFLGLAVSFLFLAAGCSLPFVYLVPYAQSTGVSCQQAAFLMSILGVLDIVGNITFGWLTDRRCLKRHRLCCYVVSVAMEGACCLLAPLLGTFELLVPFAVVYGYFDGAYVALIPIVTSDLVGPRCLSSALGVAYFLHAVPYLVSPPAAGRLVDITGSYSAAFVLSGTALLASALILTAVAGIRRRRRQLHPFSPNDQSDSEKGVVIQRNASDGHVDQPLTARTPFGQSEHSNSQTS